MANPPTGQTYAHLVNKLGQEKVDNIIKHVNAYNQGMIAHGIRLHEEQEKRLANIIPRDNLIDGKYYNGYRERGTHVAKWDKKEDCFITINFTMGQYFAEKIKYFLDVIETNLDGFIPYQTIERINVTNND
jgi:hypothetical protein